MTDFTVSESSTKASLSKVFLIDDRVITMNLPALSFMSAGIAYRNITYGIIIIIIIIISYVCNMI